MSNAVYRLIDLSKWNGKVDFNRVRCAGIDGVTAMPKQQRKLLPKRSLC